KGPGDGAAAAAAGGEGRQPTRRERRHHRDLRQRVIGGVDPNRPVDQLDQPPRQRRQLVVAELPFAAIGEPLDQIEGQIRIKQRRQGRPDRKVQREGGGGSRLRTGAGGGGRSRTGVR